MFPVPTIENIVVLAVLIGMFILLFKEAFNTAVVFIFGVILFLLFGFLEPQDVLRGFANQQLGVIMLLLILSRVIKKTGVLESLFGFIFKKDTGYRNFLAKLMAFTSTSSAFLNNTPIVSMLIPYVHEWGKRYKIAPSKLLIPLSYAAILGGTVTLIGTSTNLIVNGLAVNRGLEPFSLFDFSLVGVPLVIIGFFYLLIFSNFLLPSKKDILDIFKEKQREYLLEFTIPKGSNFVGKTIQETGLNKYPGVLLTEVVRGKKKIYPLSRLQELKADDILIFLGNPLKIPEMLRNEKGLALPNRHKDLGEDEFNIAEAMVPFNSRLIGKRLGDMNFKRLFGASVVAVHRNGVELSGKIVDIVTHAGDLLLLVYPKEGALTVGEQRDIYLISKIKQPQRMQKKKAYFTLAAGLAAILIPTFTDISLFVSLFVMLGILLLTRIATFYDVRKGIERELVFIVAFAFVIGNVLLETGTANFISDSIIFVTQGFGLIGVLLGVYLATNIITEFVTNVGAVTIMVPVAYTSAIAVGADPTPFILAVAYAASASFLTPIGYQTNLMVYGPGEYSFKDFFRIGFPLSLIYMFVTINILGVVYGFF